MANEIVPLPARSKELIAKKGKLLQLNSTMLESISVGMYPQIATSSTRFIIKKDGEFEEIDRLKIPVVILNAKGPFEKKWWRGKYDPNKTERKAPDCLSFDGVYPDASSLDKQCENCDTCEHNMFGSGTDANGDPTRGKACQDRKLLVLHYAGGIYGFSLPPGSIKAWRKYVTELDQKGYSVCEVATILGFDPSFSYAVLTFTAHGPLSDEQMSKVEELIDCEDTMSIINFGMKKQPTITHKPEPETPAITQTTKEEPEEVVIELSPEEISLGLAGCVGTETVASPAPEPVVTKKGPKKGTAVKETVIETDPSATVAARIPTVDEVDALLNL
jgi:hypothetical protein